jgi:hypothetical protein
VKNSGRRHRVKVSADGKGVVWHAGSALLRELATETGLAGGVTGALTDTYRGVPVHAPDAAATWKITFGLPHAAGVFGPARGLGW